MPGRGTSLSNFEMLVRAFRLTSIVFLTAFCGVAAAADGSLRDEVFEGKILPLLKARCGECHGGTENKSGLGVTTVAELLEGGATRGAAIVPGHPEESVLVKMISGTLKPRMPFKGEPLSAAEIALIESW